MRNIIDEPELINGSCYQGIIQADFDTMVEIFGEPSIDEEGYKVRVEWLLQFDDGTVATIYDWKEDCHYTKVTDWHIGGFDKKAVELVTAKLQNN